MDAELLPKFQHDESGKIRIDSGSHVVRHHSEPFTEFLRGAHRPGLPYIEEAKKYKTGKMDANVTGCPSMAIRNPHSSSITISDGIGSPDSCSVFSEVYQPAANIIPAAT